MPRAKFPKLSHMPYIIKYLAVVVNALHSRPRTVAVSLQLSWSGKKSLW